MNAGEPRVRHRGLFLSPGTDETESVEQEAPEGLTLGARRLRPRAPRRMTGAPYPPTSSRYSGGRLGIQTFEHDSSTRRRKVALRSATATGTHRRSRSTR